MHCTVSRFRNKYVVSKDPEVDTELYEDDNLGTFNPGKYPGEFRH